MAHPSLQAMVNDAVKALQGGQHEVARQRFTGLLSGEDPALAPARANLQLWMGLAYACGNCKDEQGALAAVEQALALEPRNPQALLFKADHLWHWQQQEQAARFYQTLLQVCESMDTPPPGLADQLDRARQRSEQVADQRLHYLRQQLAELDIDGDKVSPRFGQALAISTGEKLFYPQQPSKFFFPELPHVQFFEPGDFPWALSLQAATGPIQHELQQALARDITFAPYLEENKDLPRASSADLWGSDDWGALYLWQDGELNRELAEQFPETTRILAELPLAVIPGASPNVLFSRLKPGTDIPPHHGFFNTRLICHLPLVVPENCGELRVGNESRQWREGELLIFDDSIEHEAWNHSDRDRIVLIFEVWRPELSAAERAAISALLGMIRGYARGQS
ncbi:aspartyl beta-hydroxylase [Seongchinamella sediminis]|uniref:Aspartyl beta-hydroxylase n=1 Tax=Seongchinamella sediminis TaxID=2283635 RepID=A0A3L7DWT7_9GAMM|nr:aspartyl/asparaginyl beta-hydroxylase domain-containing protein [Seongchinamella sediminis]RLQ21774.1 aspartyl beta-hydroxylase [Seongchinamella sediminis]